MRKFLPEGEFFSVLDFQCPNSHIITVPEKQPAMSLKVKVRSSGPSEHHEAFDCWHESC